MKANFFFFLMTCIVIGMMIPAFAGSPENKGDKTKIDYLSLSLPPPSSWNLNIVVTDPNDSCYAYLYCNVYFLISWAYSSCQAISSIYNYTYPFTPGTYKYTIPIPDTIPCVLVSLTVAQPCSNPQVNSKTCCECLTRDNICYLSICQ